MEQLLLTQSSAEVILAAKSAALIAANKAAANLLLFAIQSRYLKLESIDPISSDTYIISTGKHISYE